MKRKLNVSYARRFGKSNAAFDYMCYLIGLNKDKTKDKVLLELLKKRKGAK